MLSVMFLVCFLQTSAQTVNTTICAGRLLERLEQYQPDIRQPGVYPIPALLDGKSVEVREADSVIVFVGIRLIPDVIKKEYNKLYFDFVERYWLELLLTCHNHTEAFEKLKEDHVDLWIDGNFFRLTSPTIRELINSLVVDQVKINESDSLYQVGWKNRAGKDIALQFRKRIGQVLGMDKRELEYYFFSGLSAYQPPAHVQPELVDASSLVPGNMPDVFVQKGETYLIREMTSNRYWKKTDDDRFDLLFDWTYIPESVSNLFINGPGIENDIIMKMKQRYYTSKTLHYECSLSTLTSFMKDENNHIYVGIDEMGSDKITGVVVYENRDYKYNHALYFSAPYAIFEQRAGYIDATIYTYIPMHNVQTLFDKEHKK